MYLVEHVLIVHQHRPEQKGKCGVNNTSYINSVIVEVISCNQTLNSNNNAIFTRDSLVAIIV